MQFETLQFELAVVISGLLVVTLIALVRRPAKLPWRRSFFTADSSKSLQAETLPVLIVGAGPAGLTAAAVLSRYGVPLRIVEKKANLSKTTKATNLMQRNQEFMYALGIQERLQELSGHMSCLMVHAYGKCFGPRTMHLKETMFPNVLLCGQHNYEQVLAEDLTEQGIKVEHSVSLIKLARKEDYVVAELLSPSGLEESKFS